MNSDEIGVMAVKIHPVLDDDAMDRLTEAISERVRLAVNAAIVDAFEVTLRDRLRSRA